jgi:hypothetical protein
MVNRLWQHHFGQGLVATPSNFGVRGARPTHAALLDWLAAALVERGWSLKAMHRLILTSKTWQLASEHSEANAQLDPSNDFYWRQNRRRLDAEAIRDSMLFVSGRLDLRRPGRHPFPPIQDWGYTQHNQFKAIYPSEHRTVYLMTPRLQRHPFLALFDGPDPNTSTGQRTSATVPLQALYLMNSGEVSQEARAFARRIVLFDADEKRQVGFAYECAFGRTPAGGELQRALEYLRRYRNSGPPGERAASEPAQGQRVDALDAWTSYARVLLTVNEFFYVD